MTTDSTHTTAVNAKLKWQAINPATPRGVKMQLINRNAGVATYGTLDTDPFFWTHWSPLPVFEDDRHEST